MAIEKVNLKESTAGLSRAWQPEVLSNLNGQQVKIAKFKGEFVWHKHDNEDELFLVLEGSFDMHLRDKVLTINKGELITIPCGVEHKPVAHKEAIVMLFEPASTVKLGD